ncbi:MAG TPA: ABC-F family ATP-binding cassette domain-containing protein [Anaerolineales bacterium]
MSILTTENLSVSFGDFDLFQGLNLSVANDSKIGLIGPNGVGKTTLLHILAGLSAPTSGKVRLAGGRRLAYLPQEAIGAFTHPHNTTYTEMLAVFEDLQRQGQRLAEFEQAMARGEYDDQLLEKYGDLQHAFEVAGGYEYEVRIQQVLQGLGLGEEHWHMPVSQLSGGQKTRALLARQLLEKPDLLILDEPTNHLDLEALEWLEHTLNQWDGAVLIVSHDRYFLDNTANTIWEMSPHGIEAYNGNYSAYLLQRQERWEYTQRVYKEEKARLLKEVDFIQRNWVRDSTHARALGLLRRLSRDLAVVDTYGLMALRSGKKWSQMALRVRPLDVVEAIRKVNAIQLPSARPPHIRPRLAAAHTSGNIVLRATSVTVGYPGNPLFSAQEVELRRGECAALLGPNGAGKTSFLKTLLGQLAPLEGEVKLGGGLKTGYFSQAQEHLDDGRTVLDELLAHQGMHPEAARRWLARYLFQGEEVFKQVSVLSGGERARLALAILAQQGANFLVLDEPTNHLDIPSREALQEVLDNFDGTILLVSHDRYLINRLATQIWELEDHRLQIFHGSYRQFILQRPSGSRQADKERRALLPSRPLFRKDSVAAHHHAAAVETLEARIHQQESAVQRLAGELQKAGQEGTYDTIQELSWKAAQAQVKLDDLMAEWERLAVH